MSQLFDKFKFNNTTYAVRTVYPVKGTQTATTASWTGNIDIDALYDGLTIAYYLPRTSASNVTLTLTLSTGTKTAAVPVYVTGESRMTTHYAAGSTVLLTYYSAGSISVNGTATTAARWTGADYWNSNTYDRTYLSNSGYKAGSSAIVAANIITANASGLYQHLKSGAAFDITMPILYTGAATAANTVSNNGYITIPFTITTTQSITLTPYKPIYIKGFLNGTTFTPISTTPLTQTVPTSQDSYQYMLLGYATTATVAYLLPSHQIYSYNGGKFSLYSKLDYDVVSDKLLDHDIDISLLSTSIGPEFETTKAYKAGDLVLYQCHLHRFKTAHSAGAWNNSHVDPVSVTELIKEATDGVVYTGTSPINVSGSVISHANSGVTAASKGDTANQTPGFGSTFKVPSGTVNATGHLTAFAEHTVKIPNTQATTSTHGLMTTDHVYKLNTAYSWANEAEMKADELITHTTLYDGTANFSTLSTGGGSNVYMRLYKLGRMIFVIYRSGTKVHTVNEVLFTISKKYRPIAGVNVPFVLNASGYGIAKITTGGECSVVYISSSASTMIHFIAFYATHETIDDGTVDDTLF